MRQCNEMCTQVCVWCCHVCWLSLVAEVSFVKGLPLSVCLAGSIMLFVFLLVLPTGALLARYFKEIVGAKWIKVCVFLCVSVCVCISYFCSVISCIAIYVPTPGHTQKCVCVSVCVRVYLFQSSTGSTHQTVRWVSPPFPPDSHDHHDFGSCSNDPCIWVCIRTYITGVSRGECCHDNRQ